MIQLDNLSKGFGGRELFSDLSWHVAPGERVGLVGPNGAGKSTLVKIIAGTESSDTGRIITPSDYRIGYLPQEVGHFGDETVLEEVIAGRAELLELERRMKQLQQEMADAPERATELSARYGAVQERYELLGGYTLRPRAQAILSGMGFTSEATARSLNTFSGGWQMRALLSRLLLQAPDLLLMDEPTNHLDLPSVEWLEDFLKNYRGAVIIISHDRYFLNRMVTQVAELSRGQLTLYTGNYDHYTVQREENRERLLKAAEQQRKEIAQLERFVERFKAKATKAKQAQSRLKQLEKIERIEVQSEANTIHFNFPQPPRSGKMVIELADIHKAYGDNVIYDGFDFSIERGERVALVGPNGAGKSTLLKILADATPIQGGEVTLGHNVTVQHFAQHQVEALDLKATVLEEMVRAATDESLTELRSILGAFLFSGDDVNKRVSVLSGGEKSRLAMARLLLKPANLLLLDEPTNHLDIDSRDVLEGAMRRFEGTICFISHDRHFINALATRILHIDPGVQTEYLGDYEYYQWKRKEEIEAAQAEADAAESASSASGGGSLSRKELKRRRAELRKLKSAEIGDRNDRVAAMEARVEACETEKAEIEALMADPALYEDGSRVATLSSRMSALDAELETLYEDWESLAAVLEEIESRYQEMEDALG